ncbi:MAG TPA: sigma-70 family RNA polymerase sigma factor [Steroidobacteraceae bacterium]|nr:sigma-70 family RNA polymerase sigma factor [Steroidobacteraceae bacterium]
MHTQTPRLSHSAEFATFMHAYQDMVFSTAARLTGNDAQAEDLAQETFLKAYENYEMLSTSHTAGGWLKTVVTHLALNHLSRYRKRWRLFSEFRRESDEDDSGASAAVEALAGFSSPNMLFTDAADDERRALIERSLQQLPDHHRVPLVLYHFEEMPYPDIAKHLKVSLAKVKTDIMRARAALAKILAREGLVRADVESESEHV